MKRDHEDKEERGKIKSLKWCIAGFTGRKDLIAKKKKDYRKALYGG